MTPTISHILNGCQTALTQECFTWRHDSVLNALIHSIHPHSCQLFADLPSWRASNNPPATLPIAISTSTSRPDLVLIHDKKIFILELIPSNNKEALQAAFEGNQINSILTFNIRFGDLYHVYYSRNRFFGSLA